MATISEIPLTPEPQTFTLLIGGVDYKITLQYRDAVNGGWVLDIADFNDNPIVQGIALVTGCDLLAQYKYLGIVGELWVQTDHDPDAVPTFTNLGQSSHVYLVQP